MHGENPKLPTICSVSCSE